MSIFVHKKIYLAVLGNIIPLVGVLFFHWSVSALLLSYWLENVVIGLYQVLRMGRATMNYPVSEKNTLVIGPLRPVQLAEKIFYPIFFCVHYGFFLLGHLYFLRFFGEVLGENMVFTSAIVLSMLPFFVTHGKIYVEKFLGEKEYERVALAKLFIGPYRRIFVMHAVIILGTLPLIFFAKTFPQIGIVVVVLKLVLDLVLKEKEFAFLKKVEKNNI